MAINILDSLIINRISAGEVVESPFSIVKELIDNSLDAGADKIVVEIKNGGIDLISVKDNGKGIPEKELGKIFTAGYTTKGVGVGTGLGLAICSKIIEKHNGEILVNSEVGHGSEFIITIHGE